MNSLYNFLDGEVLLFDKPLTWTSFDVVNKVRLMIRHQLDIKKIKVGHAGTLDPLATGLLIVCTGKSTKRIDTFQNGVKEYIATLKLGATTPSFDLETEVDKVYPIDHIDHALIDKVLKGFVGSIQQVPPVYSAVKIDGKRAYEYARKGEDVKMRTKTLVIDEIEIEAYSQDLLTLRIVCSKGTYIRALARDIGVKLSSGAHLVALRRTQIGALRVDNAISLGDFEKKLNPVETK